MTALVIILVEFVLSGRFRLISRRIGSDVTMRMHQLFARTALVLALLHPFLYQAPFAPARPWDTARAETLFYRIDFLTTGTIAWVLLIPFVLLAVARDGLPFRYEVWRALHGGGAAAIAAAAGYHALVGGRYSADPVLGAFWLVLIAAAFVSLAVVYVVKPLAQLRHRYRVVAVTPVAERTWEVDIVPEAQGAGMDFKAGQFAWLNIGHSPFSLRENPFSISSAPANRRRISFLIKEVGDFTRTLGAVRPGTIAYLDGPHGHLTIAARKEPGVVLIAGGVGLAPLMAIARQARASGDPRPFVLLYGNRSERQIACRGELDAMARDMASFTVVHVLSEPPPGWQGARGLVTREVIADACGGTIRPDWLHVLCGPAAMITGVERTLRAGGVPARAVLCERFTYD
ncbi:ferredoxin reductase family protein [Breoghania corrubedonensis]|nr:ferredoxin reductase family protein [Breoghania corrubedonensis]